jgi:hypothetical protein
MSLVIIAALSFILGRLSIVIIAPSAFRLRSFFNFGFPLENRFCIVVEFIDEFFAVLLYLITVESFGPSSEAT